MPDWINLVPADIAEKQAWWERRRMILRMRDAGLTFREIGKRVGLSKDRASQIVLKERWRVRQGLPSPVEEYFAQDPFPMPKVPFGSRDGIYLRYGERKRMLRLVAERHEENRRKLYVLAGIVAWRLTEETSP